MPLRTLIHDGPSEHLGDGVYCDLTTSKLRCAHCRVEVKIPRPVRLKTFEQLVEEFRQTHLRCAIGSSIQH